MLIANNQFKSDEEKKYYVSSISDQPNLPNRGSVVDCGSGVLILPSLVFHLEFPFVSFIDLPVSLHSFFVISSEMQSLEKSFEKACKDGIVPGAVLVAADKNGNPARSIIISEKEL